MPMNEERMIITATGRNHVLRRVGESSGQDFGLPYSQNMVKEWDVSQPSRGLGDDIAKLTHATGIDKLVRKITRGRDCGCKRRQRATNESVPYDGGRVRSLAMALFKRV